jgi:hypothetical protein
MMARLNADLAIFALEAFKPVGPFEPKPGKPDQLVALLPEPARAKAFAVFLNAGDSPAMGSRLRNSIAIT